MKDTVLQSLLLELRLILVYKPQCGRTGQVGSSRSASNHVMTKIAQEEALNRFTAWFLGKNAVISNSPALFTNELLAKKQSTCEGSQHKGNHQANSLQGQRNSSQFEKQQKSQQQNRDIVTHCGTGIASALRTEHRNMTFLLDPFNIFQLYPWPCTLPSGCCRHYHSPQGASLSL